MVEPMSFKDKGVLTSNVYWRVLELRQRTTNHNHQRRNKFRFYLSFKITVMSVKYTGVRPNDPPEIDLTRLQLIGCTWLRDTGFPGSVLHIILMGKQSPFKSNISRLIRKTSSQTEQVPYYPFPRHLLYCKLYQYFPRVHIYPFLLHFHLYHRIPFWSLSFLL